MSKYARRLKSTAFIITVNTNKVPSTLVGEDIFTKPLKSRNHPDPYRFREDLALMLRRTFGTVFDTRTHLDFWLTNNKADDTTVNEYNWKGCYEGTQIVRSTEELLIDQIDAFVAMEVGSRFHRLHAHIMVDIKHRGKIKVNVGAIVERFKTVFDASAVHISGLVNLFSGDRRLNMFNYINKDANPSAFEGVLGTQVEDPRYLDKYTSDESRWVRYAREKSEVMGEHGLRVIYLNDD